MFSRRLLVGASALLMLGTGVGAALWMGGLRSPADIGCGGMPCGGGSSSKAGCTSNADCMSGAMCIGGLCTPGTMWSSSAGQGQSANFSNFGGGDPVCGNATQENGEQCDDGNTTNGDGCSAVCQTEPQTGDNPESSAGQGSSAALSRAEQSSASRQYGTCPQGYSCLALDGDPNADPLGCAGNYDWTVAVGPGGDNGCPAGNEGGRCARCGTTTGSSAASAGSSLSSRASSAAARSASSRDDRRCPRPSDTPPQSGCPAPQGGLYFTCADAQLCAEGGATGPSCGAGRVCCGINNAAPPAWWCCSQMTANDPDYAELCIRDPQSSAASSVKSSSQRSSSARVSSVVSAARSGGSSARPPCWEGPLSPGCSSASGSSGGSVSSVRSAGSAHSGGSTGSGGSGGSGGSYASGVSAVSGGSARSSSAPSASPVSSARSSSARSDAASSPGSRSALSGASSSQPYDPNFCNPWITEVAAFQPGTTKEGTPMPRGDAAILLADGNIVRNGQHGLSLGYGGWVAVGFQSPVKNVIGYDVLVYTQPAAATPSGQRASVFAGSDGKSWTALGEIEGNPQAVAEFDLGALQQASYLLIVDTTVPQGGRMFGFELAGASRRCDAGSAASVPGSSSAPQASASQARSGATQSSSNGLRISVASAVSASSRQQAPSSAGRSSASAVLLALASSAPATAESCGLPEHCPSGRCLGGFCAEGCAVAADCPFGRCEAGRCRALGCGTDDDCPFGRCLAGRCKADGCGMDGDCPFGRCDGGRCIAAVSCQTNAQCRSASCAADSRCVCATDAECPFGRCDGGRCAILPCAGEECAAPERWVAALQGVSELGGGCGADADCASGRCVEGLCRDLLPAAVGPDSRGVPFGAFVAELPFTAQVFGEHSLFSPSPSAARPLTEGSPPLLALAPDAGGGCAAHAGCETGLCRNGQCVTCRTNAECDRGRACIAGRCVPSVPHAPVGDTGPAAVAVLAAGAAGGWGWVRRRGRRRGQ